jgi:hypothetical protein
LPDIDISLWLTLFPLYFNTVLEYGISKAKITQEEMEMNGPNQAIVYSPTNNTINVTKNNAEFLYRIATN